MNRAIIQIALCLVLLFTGMMAASHGNVILDEHSWWRLTKALIVILVALLAHLIHQKLAVYKEQSKK